MEGPKLGSEGTPTLQTLHPSLKTQLRSLDLRRVVPEGGFWNLSEGQSGTHLKEGKMWPGLEGEGHTLTGGMRVVGTLRSQGRFGGGPSAECKAC